MAQTALPRPVTGLQPQTSLRWSTICSPRPASSHCSGARRTGAQSDGSSTAHMTSPVLRSRRRPIGWPAPALWVACETALATNSPTITSASSASESRPHSFRVFLVKRRAVRLDWALVPSGHAATAGEAHQSEGSRTTRGGPGAHCSLAVRSRGRRRAGSILVRIGKPTWLKPIATPRSVERPSRLIDANVILPESTPSTQEQMHVHFGRGASAAAHAGGGFARVTPSSCHLCLDLDRDESSGEGRTRAELGGERRIDYRRYGLDQRPALAAGFIAPGGSGGRPGLRGRVHHPALRAHLEEHDHDHQGDRDPQAVVRDLLRDHDRVVAELPPEAS